MLKGTACSYCSHSINGKVTVGEGWSFDCDLGIDNSQINGGPEKVMECPKADLRFGFQIGGYFSYMYFERGDGVPNDCIEWILGSDGEFPTEDKEKSIQFHICDFRQIEKFVAVWGKELRRRGWVTDEDDGNLDSEPKQRHSR